MIAKSANVSVGAVCAGTPLQMGEQQGRQLRHEIFEASRLVVQLEAFQLLKPRLLSMALFRKLAEMKTFRMLMEPLRDTLPSMSDRLLGIAAGAGVRPQSLYLLNSLEAVMSSADSCSVVPPLCGCSAVSITGSRSANGEPMIARNFDYLPLIEPLYVIRDCHPQGGFRSLEFTTAPQCGAVDGVNERGLCITYNYAFVSDEAELGPPISMAVAEALGRCATVEEAADFIAATPRWGGGMLMLADAAGDIAALELSNTQCCLRRPNSGGGILFHTNQFHTETMKQIQVSPRAIFADTAPQVVRGRRVLESSERRDAQFEQAISQTETFDADSIAALMSSHGPDGVGSENTICMHGPYWETNACLQLFPRTCSMRVTFNSACNATYADLQLQDSKRVSLAVGK